VKLSSQYITAIVSCYIIYQKSYMKRFDLGKMMMMMIIIIIRIIIIEEFVVGLLHRGHRCITRILNSNQQ